VRPAAFVLLGACSFPHGFVPSATGDGGADGAGDAATDVGPPPQSPRKLVFDNSLSAIDFGPHPVLIALDASKIDYAAIVNPATDLRFENATQGITASIGDNVPFEIERWDPNGESIVWIRVPEILHATTDTAVLMHFGAGANGSASATATWQSWELVNHMASGLTSSTGNYQPSAFGVAHTNGVIGEATAFSGVGDQRVTFANGGQLFDAWPAFYVSFWIYASYNSAADLTNQPLVMDKGASVNLGRLFANAGEIVFQLDQHFTNNNNAYINVVVPPKAWTNIVLSFDGNIASIYKNGAPGTAVDLPGSGLSLVASTAQFRLGDTSNGFKGMIDELRIEKRSRSLDFARAQYLNSTRKFVTFTDP
jgi:hypothetical protein